MGKPSPALELAVEQLRLAQEALASITGAFTDDDLLASFSAGFVLGNDPECSEFHFQRHTDCVLLCFLVSLLIP